MGKVMERTYYGLPLSVLADEPEIVLREAAIVKDDPLIDVGARGLSVKFLYDSPFWEAVVFQFGEPIATIHCVLNQAGLMEGLRNDTRENLSVFNLRWE